jgi:hypothetical protein
MFSFKLYLPCITYASSRKLCFFFFFFNHIVELKLKLIIKSTHERHAEGLCIQKYVKIIKNFTQKTRKKSIDCDFVAYFSSKQLYTDMCVVFIYIKKRNKCEIDNNHLC